MAAAGPPARPGTGPTTVGAPYQDTVKAHIQAISYLPTTVAVAMKFIDLGKNPEADPAEYAKVIGSDSSLSTKLLALANSSWFGVRHRVTKVQVAVNLLGLATVRTLAISYCATGLHHKLRLTPAEMRMFWSASLSKAAAARCYLARTQPALAEEGFACGLFQDLAMPFLYASAKEPVLGYLQQAPGLEGRLATERGLFCLDHAEWGRTIAQKMELPQLFVDAVAHHHRHEALQEMLGAGALADGVYVASLFPHLLERWNAEDAQALRRFLGEQGAIQTEEFLAQVQREFDTLYGYFENGAPSQANLAQLMAEALQEIADRTTQLVGTVQGLMRETAQAGRQVEQALRERRQMEDQARHDPLTGLLNRAGLLERATQMLSDACEHRRPIAVAFLDIDGFKAINDKLGHAVGDAALRALAAVLHEHIRRQDVVARVGGDEFVLILGDCGQPDAQRVVQRIVEGVAAMAVAEPNPVITVSAGLLWAPAACAGKSVEDWLRESDRLMYDAKRAGGNRLLCRAA